MKSYIIPIIFLLFTTTAHAWTFGSKVDTRYKEYCQLDLLTQAQNDFAARSITNNSDCNKLPSITKSNPSRFHERTYRSSSECLQKYGLQTSSEFATRGIGRICSVITSKENHRDCRQILDEVISIQTNPQEWSRKSVRDWYLKNPSQNRPSGFDHHCL